MKRIITLFSAVAVALQLAAQLPDNSIAPDFTVTDINGVSHHLYDVIEQGKPVVMDISATWCGPCWSYHNSHALKTVYEQYGPDGTNEMMVYFVEGDFRTNLACLHNEAGCNLSTQGDWVTGTPYPIIDNDDISNTYDIGYFPTVYLICPNHLVKEVGALTASQLKAQADACPEPVQGTKIDAITFGTDYGFTRVCGTQSAVPSFLVVNGGTETLNSVEIELKVNGVTVQNLNYTEPITSFQPRMINFAPISMTGSTIVKATITKLNGVALATPVSKQKSYQLAKKTTTQTLKLELKTDDYAEETYWELIDDQGNVYASGGNQNVGPDGANTGTATAGAGAYANNSTIVETIDVPANGCYLLHMVDAYGDGMCSQNVTGSFKLYEAATPTNVLATGGCEFGDYFELFGADGISSVNDLVTDGSFRVFPNPAKGSANVAFRLENAADVQITVTNMLGQTVRDLGTISFVAGNNNHTVDLAGLNTGLYTVNLRTAEGVVSQTLTVQQ